MHEGLTEALELLPEVLRGRFALLSGADRQRAEEIRLRRGYPPSLVLPEGEKSLGGGNVSAGDIAGVLERASRCSLHAYSHELRRGYITARGGVRVGVCGTAVGSGEVETLRDPSSLAIRIAKELPGAGAEIMDSLWPFDRSVLIISPPGGGKTTFLRELIKKASASGKRVCLCDERGEVAAMSRDGPAFDLGPCTDVLSGAAKGEGIMMLLRAMNPQIIALDEISAGTDREAVEQAAGCGAAIFATAHGSGVEELKRRPHYAGLLGVGIFERAEKREKGERRRDEVVELC